MEVTHFCACGCANERACSFFGGVCCTRGVPQACWICGSSVSLPGGNQVDGLPPAPSTCAEHLACRAGRELVMKDGLFFEYSLLLSELHSALCPTRYHTYLTFYKGASHSVEFGLSSCSDKWLEELASESNNIQAQEDIMLARVMTSNIRAKLYVLLGWLFDDISRLMYSFEVASCVVQDIISLLPWVAAGSSRKSI